MVNVRLRSKPIDRHAFLNETIHTKSVVSAMSRQMYLLKQFENGGTLIGGSRLDLYPLDGRVSTIPKSIEPLAVPRANVAIDILRSPTRAKIAEVVHRQAKLVPLRIVHYGNQTTPEFPRGTQCSGAAGVACRAVEKTYDLPSASASCEPYQSTGTPG